MIFNLLRMPQNKAIHCYLLMSVWILLLIVGVYKFLEPKQKLLEAPTVSTELYSGLSVDIKTKRIFKICNFPDDIQMGEEGVNHWGIVVYTSLVITQELVKITRNQLELLGIARQLVVETTGELMGITYKVGIPVYKIFRLLPDPYIYRRICILQKDKWVLSGLLILIRHGDRGPLQHIKKISSINCGVENTELLTSYKDYLHNQTLSGKTSWAGPGPFHGFPFLPTHLRQCQLGQLTMQGIVQLLKLGHLLSQTYHKVWPKLRVLNPYELVIYSTRYRRTFQSALALLFGLIPHDTLTRANIYESQSMSFCFKDCGCPVTEKLSKYVRRNISHQLRSHPAVANLAETTGRSLFSTNAEQGPLGSDPHAVRDALLSFACHKSGLPCESPLNCIKRQNVVGIFAYTDWVNYQKWRNIYWRRYCLLKSYGLIRHIVQQMLQMVSNNGPYLVLYSGHDHTLEQLATALGLQNDPFLLRYAARIIFEIYQDNRESNNAKGIYFRLLSNGKDVTKQISFCKNLINVDAKTNLCKIEDIVRFLHDDYFSSLNVSNFKDACLYKNG